jgi:hypothetical protein
VEALPRRAVISTQRNPSIREQARRVRLLVEEIEKLPPVDRRCVWIRLRWVMWRPVWLRWIDPILEFILFPPRLF